MKKLAVAASALALMSAAALAQDNAATHEFPLTQGEFLAAYPEVTMEDFALIDTNGDGEISQEEYQAAEEAGLIGGYGG